jgi:hypothetical protein
MGSPYLNNNETILLSTHNVVINTIPAEAILTNQRLILIDARHTQLRPQDIPFTSLETVTIGETSAMDPVLSLSVVLPDETRHTLGIIFPQAPKMKRIAERDEWATKIKGASLAAQKDNGVKPAELLPPWVAGEIPEEEGTGSKNAGAAEEKFVNPPLAPRKPRTKPSSGNRRILVAAGIVLVLIIACVAGVFFFAPSFAGSVTTPPATVVTPSPTATTPETPVVTVLPTTAITPEPAVTAPSPAVTTAITPAATQTAALQMAGVWIRIDYAGNYTASFGTSGRMKEISDTGSQYFQIPAKDQIVEASVQKLDDSGGLLTVSIYNNGVLVKSDKTTKPHGTVEIHADLRTTSSAASA